MAASPTPSLARSSSSSDISLSAHDDALSSGSLSPRFDKYWYDSDLVLKSSDNILFKVHKARLAGCSAFELMFEVGSDKDFEQEHYKQVPTVALSEDATTLENVLPFFYDEFVDVDSLSFQEALAAFETAVKYGMTLVEHIYTARLRRMFPRDIRPDQAFQLWKLCSILDRPSLAAMALPLTAKGNILTYSTTELHPRDLDRLWRTHMHQIQTQADMLFKFAWQTADGSCYYFNISSHSNYMRKLILAKASGLPIDEPAPLGFHTCEKCHRMALQLDLILH